MKITISNFSDLGRRITLVGRSDIFGTEKIEGPLKEIAGSDTNIVIDMKGVDFLASNCVRQLVIAAKTVARNSRRLVCSTRTQSWRWPDPVRPPLLSADRPQ